MLKVFAQKCSSKYQQRSSLPLTMVFPGIIPYLSKGNKPTAKGRFLEGAHLRRAENTNTNKT